MIFSFIISIRYEKHVEVVRKSFVVIFAVFTMLAHLYPLIFLDGGFKFIVFAVFIVFLIITFNEQILRKIFLKKDPF
jgi:hypothetical protein